MSRYEVRWWTDLDRAGDLHNPDGREDGGDSLQRCARVRERIVATRRDVLFAGCWLVKEGDE